MRRVILSLGDDDAAPLSLIRAGAFLSNWLLGKEQFDFTTTEFMLHINDLIYDLCLELVDQHRFARMDC
jgi:hypothetical protein